MAYQDAHHIMPSNSKNISAKCQIVLNIPIPNILIPYKSVK